MKNTILFLTTVLILGIFNYSIYEKQQILKGGELILLQLTPVDPRSLIQGDHMQLGYAIENEMAKRKPEYPKKNGWAVITLDLNKIAKFSRFYDGGALTANEKLIKYHYRPSASRVFEVRPNGYFIQEDHNKEFLKAKFAIFRYSGYKDYLLVGLGDAAGNIIDPTLIPLATESSHSGAADQ